MTYYIVFSVRFYVRVYRTYRDEERERELALKWRQRRYCMVTLFSIHFEVNNLPTDSGNCFSLLLIYAFIMFHPLHVISWDSMCYRYRVMTSLLLVYLCLCIIYPDIYNSCICQMTMITANSRFALENC